MFFSLSPFDLHFCPYAQATWGGRKKVPRSRGVGRVPVTNILESTSFLGEIYKENLLGRIWSPAASEVRICSHCKDKSRQSFALKL